MGMQFELAEKKTSLAVPLRRWSTRTLGITAGAHGRERQAFRPAASSAAMHDFSRIAVHAPATRADLRDDTACASGRFGKNGGTGCDASTGKTVTNIYDPPPCYRHCVVRHEAVHARDIKPCCARAGVAYKAAKSDDARQAVQDKFDKWMLSNEDYLECRAYTESAKCGQQSHEETCVKKKQDAGATSDLPRAEAKPPVSLEPGEQRGNPAMMDPASAAGETQLAEDKPDAGVAGKDKPDAGGPGPGSEQCCPALRCYWRVSAGRANNVCDRAPKALSQCPW